MKSNLLKNVLDWVLATGVLLSIIFFAQYLMWTREMRALAGTVRQEAEKYQQNHQGLALLINATVEYNKARPDANLARILENLTKSSPSAGATQQTPAAK